MFYLLALIIKFENSLIWKKPFRMNCRIDKFCITCWKLITIIELQHYVNLEANFNINKFENLSIRFVRQSIIPVDTGRKLNVHKTLRRRPGCLLNVLGTFNLRPGSTGISIQSFFNVME